MFGKKTTAAHDFLMSSNRKHMHDKKSGMGERPKAQPQHHKKKPMKAEGDLHPQKTRQRMGAMGKIKEAVK